MERKEKKRKEKKRKEKKRKEKKRTISLLLKVNRVEELPQGLWWLIVVHDSQLGETEGGRKREGEGEEERKREGEGKEQGGKRKRSEEEEGKEEKKGKKKGGRGEGREKKKEKKESKPVSQKLLFQWVSGSQSTPSAPLGSSQKGKTFPLENSC